MFESLLPAVTLVALGLLAPSSVVAMVLARGRHASASTGGDRRGRVAVAAGVAAAAGGTAGWFLGAGPVAAALTSVILAAPVVVWAYLAPWWPVRAVVAWAMLVTGSVGTVAMAAARALESPQPWTAVPVAGLGAAVVVLVLERLNGPFRKVLGIRAGIRRAVRTPIFLRPALLRPALALAVFFAALAAGGLTGVAPGPGAGRTPEAGSGPDPGRGPTGGPVALDGSDVRPVSATATTPSESVGGGGTSTAAQGSRSARTSRTGGTGGGSGSGSSATAAGGAAAGGTTTGGSSTATGAASGGGDGTTTSGSSQPGGGGDQGGNQDGLVKQVTDTVTGTVDTVEQTLDPVLDGGGSGGGGGSNGGSGGGGGALEPVQSAVEDTVEPVQSVVEKTVEPVASTVDSTVAKVTDPIGSALP